jgi:hypothetical protein
LKIIEKTQIHKASHAHLQTIASHRQTATDTPAQSPPGLLADHGMSCRGRRRTRKTPPPPPAAAPEEEEDVAPEGKKRGDHHAGGEEEKDDAPEVWKRRSPPPPTAPDVGARPPCRG